MRFAEKWAAIIGSPFELYTLRKYVSIMLLLAITDYLPRL